MVNELKTKSALDASSFIAGAGRPGPSLSSAPATAAAAAPIARPKTFLIVDDDTAFRDRLVRALIARGLQARGAPCSADAIALARTSPPEAATVDLRMPGGGGLDLIRDLLALSPRIQIVVLTGYGNIATAVEAVRRGAIDYLTKPLDTDQILAAFDPAAQKSADAAIELTPTLARVEWEHIQRILTDCNGNISKAARKLGLHRRSLQRKLGKLPPEE
jgi:two-component system response regulator RegA